jgi:hypothetical protein
MGDEEGSVSAARSAAEARRKRILEKSKSRLLAAKGEGVSISFVHLPGTRILSIANQFFSPIVGF